MQFIWVTHIQIKKPNKVTQTRLTQKTNKQRPDTTDLNVNNLTVIWNDRSKTRNLVTYSAISSGTHPFDLKFTLLK